MRHSYQKPGTKTMVKEKKKKENEDRLGKRGKERLGGTHV